MVIALALIGVAIAVSLAMTAAWEIAGRTGQSGWIDATWSFATGAGGVVLAVIPGPHGLTARQLLVAGLVAAWSLRLGLHIAGRTIGSGDDPRYARLREEWGDAFRRRLFWFLQIQAAAALLLDGSILIAAHNPSPRLGIGDGLGGLILLVAVLGEAIADRQLTRFRATQPPGGVCDSGLWSLSRHPNYFFEWLGWVAYAVIALGPGYTLGWLALSGPLFMYWLLVHVSGVPLLEAHMLRSRGEAYRAYQTRVGAFWPIKR